MRGQYNIFDASTKVFTNPTTRYIIDHFKDKYKADFDVALKNWRDRCRNFIKEKTALRLQNETGSPIVIPVYNEPDAIDGFGKAIQELYGDLDIMELIHLTNFIQHSNTALKYYEKSPLDHARLIKNINYARKTLKKFDPDKIVKDLFNHMLNKPGIDILGCYYHSRKIEIFYIPLIIFCEIKKISFESLYAIVLVHEWAHAYHHIGKDADGNQWNNYAKVDTDIKESLAQYYTAKFAEEYSPFNTQLHKAYKVLLDMQSGPYTKHLKYIDVGYEQVRKSILYSRKHGVTEFKDFYKLVKSNK